jgi:PII-like signaling protein
MTYTTENARLADVSEEELHNALVEMLKTLGVAGSTSVYNLYEVVQAERRKDVEHFQKGDVIEPAE